MKKIKHSPIALASLVVLAGLTHSNTAFAVAGDADNDGVADGADAFPCVSSVSSVQAFPAAGQYATSMYEDQWPSLGDFDFNDLVLAHNVEMYRDSTNRVRVIRGVFVPQAMGATFDNGAAWRLPISTSTLTSLGATITRQVGSGAVQTVQPISGESDVVVSISDNIRTELFAGVSDQVNTRTDRTTSTAQRVIITVTFPNTGVQLDNAIQAFVDNPAPFDTFLFRSGQYSHQIHRPQFAGTAQMRQDLFGTLDDGSTPSRHFVDTRGVPFVLDVPVATLFPKEDTRVENLFPRIVNFAASGGTTNTDFHSIGVQTTFGFSQGLGGSTLAALPAIPSAGFDDQSCVAGASCKTLRAGGATASGVYSIDPDGSGAAPAVNVFCDMTTDGGGWTLVSSANFPPDDNAIGHSSNLTTLSPSSRMDGLWDGLRASIAGNSDVRFSCQTSLGGAMAVDLSFYDVGWYREITATTSDAAVCFEEGNGAGQTLPVPSRRNNLTGVTLAVGDAYNSAGYLEGEDSCGDTGDFSVDFDDRGMDSNQSDGTDWGEDDGAIKCGNNGVGAAWFVWVR